MTGMADFSRVNGVIFDLDGTLVDSRLDFAVIRQEVGCPPDSGVLEFIDTLPAHRQAEAHAVVLRHERQGAARATWMPGAQAFLNHLRQHGLPTAILTRNARELAGQTQARLGIEVDLLLAREDCAPKPAPDGLLMIADYWELPPSQLVYVGDFLYDLQAARRAGMIACYYDPGRSGRFRQHADWLLHDFHQAVVSGAPASG
ncbi:MAG: HAD family hydrolase [Alcanivorax sp.]|nr:HAD family hydrolase [Alcanivorax sp.]